MSNDAPFLLDVTRLIWRRWKGRRPTGVDRVCLAYLHHFAGRAQAVIQYRGFRRIIGIRASQDLFRLLEQPSRHFRSRLLARAPRYALDFGNDGRGRIYLNVGHTGLDRGGFRNWAARANVRAVYLVHDLIPISHPQFCRAGEAERHERRMRTVLDTAAGVIGNSEATLDALNDFARAQGLPIPPQIAASLGIESWPAGNVSQPVRPTFVALGTIEARKNHLLLLDIWARLIEELGEHAPRLLIIGQRGWEAEQVFERLDQDRKLSGHVVELNYCTDEELRAHLASARALLFPSFAEGYGLPLIEALALRVPVIASDLPAFREIAAGVPELLDPRDRSGWEMTIREFARTESPARNAQLDRIKAFRTPDWAGHFARVESWLASL